MPRRGRDKSERIFPLSSINKQRIPPVPKSIPKNDISVIQLKQPNPLRQMCLNPTKNVTNFKLCRTSRGSTQFKICHIFSGI